MYFYVLLGPGIVIHSCEKDIDDSLVESFVFDFGESQWKYSNIWFTEIKLSFLCVIDDDDVLITYSVLFRFLIVLLFFLILLSGSIFGLGVIFKVVLLVLVWVWVLLLVEFNGFIN